jgi:hypothetical protein
MLSGGLFGAKRRKGRPVDGRQAGNELELLAEEWEQGVRSCLLPSREQ